MTGYSELPNARRPPFVLRGDTLTAHRIGIGNKMTDWVEKWLDQGRRPLPNLGRGRFGLSVGAHPPSPRRPCRFWRALDLSTGSDFFMSPAAKRHVGGKSSQKQSNRQIRRLCRGDRPHPSGPQPGRTRTGRTLVAPSGHRIHRDALRPSRIRSNSVRPARAASMVFIVSKTQPIPVCGIP
jgi:hypothetical protein